MDRLTTYKNALAAFRRDAKQHLIDKINTDGTVHDQYILKKGLVTIEQACEFCINMYTQVDHLNNLLMDTVDQRIDEELRRALDHAEHIQELDATPKDSELDALADFEEYQRQNALERVSDEDQSDLTV